MEKTKTKTYYMVTKDGELVVHGNKIHLFLRKKDASLVKGDVVEKVHLVQDEKKVGR